MRKLNKYQKRYIWNHKRASRENVTWHDIHVWAVESESRKPVQHILSAKHPMPMLSIEDFKNIFRNKYIRHMTYVTTEMNEGSAMSSFCSVMSCNK